jgi:hypothetical protein
VQVGHPAGEPVEDRVVDVPAGVADGLAGVLDEFPGGYVVAGHPDHRAVEQPAALQPVERAEGHRRARSPVMPKMTSRSA